MGLENILRLLFSTKCYLGSCCSEKRQRNGTMLQSMTFSMHYEWYAYANSIWRKVNINEHREYRLSEILMQLPVFLQLYLTQVIHYASTTSYFFSWHACQSLSCQKKTPKDVILFLQKLFHSCSSQDPTSQSRSTSLRLSPAKDLILLFITCFPHPFSF